MKSKLIPLISFFAFVFTYSVKVFAEGTKQIRVGVDKTPDENNATRLTLYYTPHFNYRSIPEDSSDYRLNIRIKDPTNERIHFGFKFNNLSSSSYDPNNIGDNNLYVKIFDPNGNLVYGPTVIPKTAGPGYIANFNSAVAGPNTIMGGTYTPQSYSPTAAGDYFIAFNYGHPDDDLITEYGLQETGDGFLLDLFDVTVEDVTADTAIGGRLHAKLWHLFTTTSAGGFDAEFNGDMYTYSTDSVITKFDFLQFDPLLFQIACNSTGVFNTGNVTSDRQSSNLQVDALPEYPLFINKPDTSTFIIGQRPKFTNSSVMDGCLALGYDIFVETNHSGTGYIKLDFLPVGSDPRDREIVSNLQPGLTTVSWDGQDNNGNIVADGELFDIYIRYEAGVTHLPLVDAENNPYGFGVELIAPKSNQDTIKLYWDDTQVFNVNTWGGSNLTGVRMDPLGVNGVPRSHSWGNDVGGWGTPQELGPPHCSGCGKTDWGDQRTINTWWVSHVNFDTVLSVSMVHNCMPVANRDTFNLVEDQGTQTFNVQGNDFDGDGDVPTGNMRILNGAFNGTSFINGQNINYTSNLNYYGVDSIQYEICDAYVCDTAWVTIFISPVNDCPVAVDDSRTLPEDSPTIIHNVQANDSDVDDTENPPYTNITIITVPAKGVAVISANTTAIDYTPNANLNGLDSLQYRICDGSGCCATAWLRFTISAVNDCPIANDDTRVINEDEGVVSVPVQTNDTDLDDGENPPYVNFTIITPASNGNGVVSRLNISYTSDVNYNGLDSIQYRICDPSGCCATAWLRITVTSVNDCPVAVDDNLVITEDDPTTQVNVQVNDSDVDTEHVIPFTGITVITAPTKGTAVINANGTDIDYSPNANANGLDSLQYRICDGANCCVLAWLRITINSVNDCPVALDDTQVLVEDQGLIVINVQGNDSDVDQTENPPYSNITIVTAPQNGFAVINGTNVNYTANSNYNGLDSLEYQICDGSGCCVTAWVRISISATNDCPIAVNDNVVLTEDDPLVTINVQINDTDVDVNDNIPFNTITIITPPTKGVANINGNNTHVDYTPNANANGLDSLQYRICDGAGCCATAWLRISITPVNDCPVAVDDSQLVIEDQGMVIVSVQDNDTDVDAEENPPYSNITIIKAPQHGIAAINIDNQRINYTVNPNYSGLDSLEYRICDGSGCCAAAWLRIVISALNDCPVANDDSVVLTEDDPTTQIDVQVNDTDGDLTENPPYSTITIITGPTKGVASISGTDIDYTPTANANGLDSLQYRICDGAGCCVAAWLRITINAVNDCPVAADDVQAVSEDPGLVVINVQANDTDVDQTENPPYSNITIVTAPQNGFAVINGTNVDYTVNANYNGPDSLEYQICDGSGCCATAWVRITVASVNDCPVAVNDNYIITEDDPLSTFNVQVNDSDADSEHSVPFSNITIITPPTKGVANINGNLTDIDYTPGLNGTGLDSLRYRICDDAGCCVTAWVYFDVTAVNDCPVANDDSGVTNEDTAKDFDVQANDSDPDANDVLPFANITIITPPLNGVAVLNGTKINYDPAANFFGIDSIEYRICDATGCCVAAWLRVNVVDQNDCPVAIDDEPIRTNEDSGPVEIPVHFNDTDPDFGSGGDVHTRTVITPPQHGTATFQGDTSVIYTSDLDYFGPDSIQYRLCDQGGCCSNAWVRIMVSPINDCPIASDDFSSLIEDATTATIDVQQNDIDVDSYHTIPFSDITIVTPPTKGVAVISSNGTDIDYTLNANENGTDSLRYQICDGDGCCAAAWLRFTVTSVNDCPIVVDDFLSVNEDAALTQVNVQANDTDEDIEHTIPFSTITILTPANIGTANVNPNGTDIDYTPDANFNGNDSVQYRICDAAGCCATGWLRITVSSVNDCPVAVDDSQLLTEDQGVITINVQANDSDVDNADVIPFTTISILTAPTKGSASISVNGTDIDYTLNPDTKGLDSLQYQICDAAGCCVTAWLRFSVTSVNDCPVAVDDVEVMDEDSPTVTVDVQNNDSDADAEHSVPFNIISIVTPPTQGNSVISSNGISIDYTPNANFEGTDSLEYRICDPSGCCATAWLRFSVNAVNDCPVAVDDNEVTQEDTPKTFDVQGNDSDVDNADVIPLVNISIITGASNGLATLNGIEINYVPNADFYGLDSVRYRICDATGCCAAAWLYISVSSQNDCPTANDDEPIRVNEDTPPFEITVQWNDTDPDFDNGGDALTTSVITQPQNGAATVQADTNILYTPSLNYNGPDSIEYRVCDQAVCCATAWVRISVSPVNDKPIAFDDLANMCEDEETITIDAKASDTDVDIATNGDVLTISAIITAPQNGFASVVAQMIEYTPSENFNGKDSLRYEISDSRGAFDTAWVKLDVCVVNDCPTALNDIETVTEDDAMQTFTVMANDDDVDIATNGDVITLINIITPPVKGTAAKSGNNITYTPNPDLTGMDSLQYRISDGSCFDTAWVYISITPINDAPVANADNYPCFPEDSPIQTIDVQGNDTDVDGTLPYTIAVVLAPYSGVAGVSGTGITYTPNLNFNGQDSLRYRICDGGTLNKCAEAWLFLCVSPVNDCPIANNDGLYNVNEDQAAHIANVILNDSDVDSIPNNDSIWVSTVIIVQGTKGVAQVLNNKVEYTPSLNEVGADSIQYKINDRAGCVDSAWIFYNILPLPDCPEAYSDTFSLFEDEGVITLDVQGNDVDPDGDALSTEIVINAENGFATLNGFANVDYTSNLNYNGLDSVLYRITDGSGCYDSSWIHVTIVPVNDPPENANDNLRTNINIEKNNLDLSGNNYDLDGDSLYVDRTSFPTTSNRGGTVSINPDGTVRYEPPTDSLGLDTLIYTVCDGSTPNLCVVDTLFIRVVDDVDGDGIPDILDLDDDNDGIPDSVEVATAIFNSSTNIYDTDGDGTPDQFDVDSDNDGIFDMMEADAFLIAGVTDLDSNGMVDDIADADGDGLVDLFDNDDTTIDSLLSTSILFDTDGDGVQDNNRNTDGDLLLPDFQDVDSDDDGILDETEGEENGTTDTDRDGLPDYRDLDSDNDGVLDITEGDNRGATDTDSDGIPDFRDLDSDDDGILDETEGDNTGTTDTDGDGLPDYRDLDSDDDGIFDATEGETNGSTDTDSDGTPDFRDTDSDGDGIDDVVEGEDDGTTDTDENGIPDYRDLDSDDDGIPDAVEGDNNGATDTDGDGEPDFRDADSDDDGIPDSTEGGNGGVTDTDSDGIPDFRDTDSDNDGILDEDEGPDGENGETADTDGDGIPDYQDTDSDNDGILDETEDDNGGTTDTDGDGIPDFRDLDSDNDGILDETEGDNGGGTDTDGDGIPDFKDLDSDGDGILDQTEGENGGSTDTDSDGTPDFRDTDSDGDGIDDAVEDEGDGTKDTDNDGTPDFRDTDSDGDGIDDAVEGDNNGSTDTDNDGIPDFRDLDSDDDGIDDTTEWTLGGDTDIDGDGLPDFRDPDSDGDGIDDETEWKNGGNSDEDRDGKPDYRDPDSDGDGIDDAVEGEDNGTTDTDNDDFPDYKDQDSDGDGIVDRVEGEDNGSTDTNGDGIPDFRDLDSDGDGIEDAAEGEDNGSVDTDEDGIPDFRDLDSDGDGVDDADERDPNGDDAGPDDSDGDGIPDFRDQDDDGDNVDTKTENDLDYPYGLDCDNDGIPNYLDSDICYAGVEIPEGFSPNGDGVNDVFEIKGLERFENASIIIFNRWGNKIFEANPYNNDWDGTNARSSAIGINELPIGTYFYVLDLGEENDDIPRLYKSAVYLNR